MATKKVKAEVTVETQQPKTFWGRIKAWFYYSESVFLNWVYGAVGSITAVVMGILSSTDFSNIFSMLQSGLTFNKQQLMVMGIGAVGMGILGYWTRVRNTKEVAGHLLPKAN